MKLFKNSFLGRCVTLWVLSQLIVSLVAEEGAGGGRVVESSGNCTASTTDALVVAAGLFHCAVLDIGGQVINFPGRGPTPEDRGFADAVNLWNFFGVNSVLLRDGTLPIWGPNVPNFGDLSGLETEDEIVDAALAFRGVGVLRSDGTLGAYGENFNQAIQIPGGLDLTQIVDIGVGFRLVVVVKADGTVLQWGDAPPPPAGLSDVVAVHSGDHSVIALRSDGTVVSWGLGAASGGEPAGLTDVYSVHAGIRGDTYAAIKGDSTLVTWGMAGAFDGPGIVGTSLGQAVPDQLAILQPGALPCANLMPRTSTKDEGTPHLIKVHSYSPVASYQWKLDGVDLPGETKPHLYIDGITAADVGDYTVAMTNPNGTVVTEASTLLLNLLDQTIDFPALADRTFGDGSFDLAATASSDLPVEFSLVSGPATIDGATVTITGAGVVVVRAEQAGDAVFDPAPPVEQSFSVAKLAAGVTLSDLEYVYDGTAKSPTVLTDPE
ncbi:MAG: hypothetical protein ACR2RV_26455, partial [Verrucomicrobiales bacterium]